MNGAKNSLKKHTNAHIQQLDDSKLRQKRLREHTHTLKSVAHTHQALKKTKLGQIRIRKKMNAHIRRFDKPNLRQERHREHTPTLNSHVQNH